jgi:iron complex outermembrane receptor protein
MDYRVRCLQAQSISCVLASAALLALVPDAAHAADPAAPAADGATAPEGQAIIVTGTRQSARTLTESLAPIDVFSIKDLQTSGKQSVRDLLGTLAPSITVSGSGAGASFAVKTVALRGLAGDEVLVLVNGKRRHDTATLFINGTTQNGQSPPDLDLIASNSVARIEVLRDGASAQYGSDAIAGVINIIQKDDLSGSASLLGGTTWDGGGNTGRATLDKGFAIGDARIHLSAEGWSQERTVRSNLNPGQFYAHTGQLYGSTAGTPDPREATVNRNVNLSGQPASAGANLNYDAVVPTEHVELYSFGSYSYRRNDAFLTYRFPDASNNIPEIFPNGYSPHLYVTDHDYQVAAGARSVKGADIHFDLSTSYAQDIASYIERNALNVSLGPTGPMTLYIGEVKSSEWVSNLDLQKDINLGLVQPLSLAAGAEFRRNSYTIGAGAPDSYIDGGYKTTTGAEANVLRTSGSQGVTGFPQSSAGTWDRNAWSVYLNAEQKIVTGVDVSLAGRHEHYSDFGSTNTGKASLRIEPVNGLAFRGTASTGFRAPTLQQEHYSSASTINVGGVLLPVSALPVDSAAGIALGATPLNPERSTDYSGGVVFTALPRFNLTVDAYQIAIRDRILLSSTLQGALVRSVLASAGITSSAGGFYFSNAADTRTRGIDIVSTYRADLGALGTANLSLSSNFNTTVFTHVDSAPAVLAGAGLVLIGRDRQGDFTKGSPRSKIIGNIDWQKDGFGLNVRATHYGSVTQVSATSAAQDATVDPKVIVDLEASYKFPGGVRLAIGANNLFNIYPNQLPTALQGNGFNKYNTYSPYGFSGGFYYARASFSF